MRIGQFHIHKNERGQSLSVFTLIVVVAIFGVLGLVIDGGNHSSATRRCEQAAAEAARAASDAGSVSRAGQGNVDIAAAMRAGEQSLANRGLNGTVRAQSGAIHVETSTEVPTYFLSLIGITSLTATGQAEAVLVATPGH